MKQKVFVAMSGGVDSSVAAALLKLRGFDVAGVYMKQWTPNGFEQQCPWKRNREDALRVASVLGIPFETWDFSKEYEKHVAKYMIDAYKKGITPNPDVMCNKIIKFGLFFDRAPKEGADYIATGHYARSKNGKLYTGLDKNKDQSYFLWTLTQNQIKKTLFPIGDLEKPEVRQLAKKFKLPTFDKKDSQGVCFVGDLDFKQFLQKYIKPKQGKVMSVKGEVLGTHDGVYYYTIGQRHGLNLGIAGGPYYVVKKDLKKNIIYVGKEVDLLTSHVRISDIHWVNKLRPSQGLNLEVKIRYRSPNEKATLTGNKLKFAKPLRAVTSGQSAVFYKGQQLLGGAIIQ